MQQDKISLDQLIFPVISFSKGNVVDFAKSSNELTQCNKRALKNGFFKNLLIVDCSGTSFKVKDATKIGTVGLFWGYDFFLDQKIRVAINFHHETETILLESFKDKILKIFKKDEYFWNSDGELEERTSFVQNANTHGEIIKRLTDEFYKEYR
jgi:hypothetical protein